MYLIYHLVPNVLQQHFVVYDDLQKYDEYNDRDELTILVVRDRN
jgi:hypothetical protein